MKTVDIDTSKLNQTLEAEGISGYRLARISDVSQPTIARVLAGKGKPTLQTWKKICKALKLDSETGDPLEGKLLAAFTRYIVSEEHVATSKRIPEFEPYEGGEAYLNGDCSFIWKVWQKRDGTKDLTITITNLSDEEYTIEDAMKYCADTLIGIEHIEDILQKKAETDKEWEKCLKVFLQHKIKSKKEKGSSHYQ